ncbi:hypothetical protein HDV06_002081 [Boothiomyces sp. JEL0866]|nr:hypothetical protein HDV06_002081 [Boothiomyces sp. JEL0866]
MGISTKELPKPYSLDIMAKQRVLLQIGLTNSKKFSKRDKKISDEHEKWILDYFIRYPTNFLRECQFEFNNHFEDITINTSSIWNILNSNGFSYKVADAVHFK